MGTLWTDTAGTAMSWWRIVSEVSPRVVTTEAMREARIAVIGDEVASQATISMLCGGNASSPYVTHLLLPPDAITAKVYAFRLYVSSETSRIGMRDAASISYSGTFETCAARMMELRPDLAVALGRRFPGLRNAAASWVVKSVALANLQFAMLSAIPGILPITAPFLPASSFADLIVLTKNQTMMVLRLGAIYGQRPGITTQVKEILSTVGAAFGWRSVARQAAGWVPAGAGVVLKGVIAWSGTVAVGKVAEAYYIRGVKPAASDVQAASREADSEAKDIASSIADDLLGGKSNADSNPSDDV
ncbi:MAG: hypothetical protein ACKO14_02195 [Armatimonadota bacterium]